MPRWPGSGTVLRTLSALVVGLVILAASGCAEESHAPREGEIRALISRAEELAEDRNLEAFRDLVSDDYSDARGNSKQSLVLLLNYYFSANRSIHLLTRVPQIHFADSSHADLLVFVAMAGRPISAEQLAGMNADLYHVFATVVEEDDGWKIVAAQWARGWEVELEDGAGSQGFRGGR